VFNVNDPIGGGEILNLGGNGHKYQYLDGSLIAQYQAVPIIRLIVVAMLIVCCALLVLRILNIKTLIKGNGIRVELKNVNTIRVRDARIIKINKGLIKLTKKVNDTPFKVSEINKEYIRYNLHRAGVMAPGNHREISVDEFNAICKLAEAILICISVFVTIFLSSIIGFVGIIVSVVLCSYMPMACIRHLVASKDKEVQENFMDIYLMIHYVLLRRGQTPISRMMASYAKTCESDEMKRFIDVSINHMETVGEYEACPLIERDYREIPEVCKLMRLIRQYNEGGEVSQELVGFKNELISNQKYKQKLRREKIIAKNRRALCILYIILGQAILSALAIYLPDLGTISSIFGMGK